MAKLKTTQFDKSKYKKTEEYSKSGKFHLELKKQHHQSNKKLKQVKFNDTKSTVYFNTDKHNEVLSLINTPPCNKDEKVFTQKTHGKSYYLMNKTVVSYYRKIVNETCSSAN